VAEFMCYAELKMPEQILTEEGASFYAQTIDDGKLSFFGSTEFNVLTPDYRCFSVLHSL